MIVISDTAPIIFFAKIEILDLLKDLYTLKIVKEIIIAKEMK